MNKFVSLPKYKAYLESKGYTQKGVVDYGEPIRLKDYIFSKEGDKNVYKMTIYADPFDDCISSINYGHGTPYSGCWKRIKVDFRKKFWKELAIND